MPLGIVVLMVLQIVSGIQLLLSCWFYVVLYSWATSPAGKAEIATSGSRFAEQYASGIFLLLSIVIFALAISSFLLSRGYIYGRASARGEGRRVAVVAILIAVIGFIFMPKSLDTVSPSIALLSVRFLPASHNLASPFWTVVFNLEVIIYLETPTVKAYFKPNV